MNARAPLDAWHALPDRQRLLATAVALLLALALAVVAARPLSAANARLQEEVSRARLVQQVTRERIVENESLARASTPTTARDLRAAVTSALARFDLQGKPASSDEGRFGVVVEQAPFDKLVAAMDALAREEGVHAIEATLIARVEPGTVRAELTFSR